MNQLWTVQAPTSRWRRTACGGVQLLFDGSETSVVFEPAGGGQGGLRRARREVGGFPARRRRRWCVCSWWQDGQISDGRWWWHKFKMPSSAQSSSALVRGDTGRNISGVCHSTLAIVRGFEDTSPGVTLPRSARMVLHNLNSAVGAYESRRLLCASGGGAVSDGHRAGGLAAVVSDGNEFGLVFSVLQHRHRALPAACAVPGLFFVLARFQHRGVTERLDPKYGDTQASRVQ